MISLEALVRCQRTVIVSHMLAFIPELIDKGLVYIRLIWVFIHYLSIEHMSGYA